MNSTLANVVDHPPEGRLDEARQSETAQGPSAHNRAFKWPGIWHGVGVFAISLSIALLFQQLAEPPRRALCFDARQYLSNTQHICDFVLSVLHGQPTLELVTNRPFVEAILTDGPVFPGFFAGIFALAGHSPSINEWRTIQCIQSVLHALSASMVFLLSFRFTGNLRIGTLSGLLWGAYPAAVFWSAVYYTETTVVFFLLLFLVLFSQKVHHFRSSFCSAVAAGAIILLKPALVPAAVLSCLSLCGTRKTFFAVALGLILTVAPWAVYTKFTTGQARFTAYRNPSFNLAMGADSEVDGCYVWPGTPLTTMFAQDECAIAFPLAQWQFRTAECLRMSARKLSCLLGSESNDLRQSYFGIEPVWLNWPHRLLIVSGFAGFMWFIFGGFTRLDRWRKRVGFSLAIFIAGHLTYVLFTPTARYGFTAMPLLCIFAGYALHCLANKNLLPRRRGLILAAVALTAWSVLLFFGETWARRNEPTEQAHQLLLGETALKEIDLANTQIPQNIEQVLLLIDGNDGVNSAEVSINGTVLNDHPAHLRKFSSRVYDRCWDLRSLGYPMGILQDQFRQWKAVPVAPSLIHWHGKNTVTVSSKVGSCTIYSNQDPLSRQILSPDYCSVNNVSNSPDSVDPRIVSQTPSARVHQASMIHKAPSANLTDTKDSLRIAFCVQFSPSMSAAIAPAGAIKGASTSLAPADSTTPFEYEFRPSDFDLFMQDKSIHGIRTNRHVMRAAQRMGGLVSLPPAPTTSHMTVKVTGLLRSQGKNGKAGIVVAILPGRGTSSLTLAATPDYIQADNNWKRFVIEDRIPVELLGQGKRSLYFAVYPGPWLDICGYGPGKKMSDIQLKEIRARISYESYRDLSHDRSIFY